MGHIQIEASGENGMRQHFIFWHVFSARRMYDFPLSSMMITLCAVSSVKYPPVCASCSRSSRRYLMMLFSRLSQYALLHPGSQLLSCRLAGRTIFTGSTPTRDSIGMLRINAWWLPTPCPKGITQSILTSMLLDIHSPSIGFDPLKNVAPALLPVCWRIASCKSNPSLSANAFPIAPSITCLL
jgi:hypothetical protein